MRGPSYFLLLCLSLRKAALGVPIEDVPLTSNTDPGDFGWVTAWTAIGDSFAAGIGAGHYPETHEDGLCSRYGDAYPVILNDLMNNPQASFKFVACTGATSTEIIDQAKYIGPGSQDLITISAGGNDVGFSTVLKECVYLPSSEPDCDTAISKASSLVENDLLSNIESLLQSVLPAMKDGGIVAYTLYGQFFNETATACNDQSWVLFDPTGRSGKEFGLKLTTQKRQKMNEMVRAANKRIRTAISNSRNDFDSRHISLVVADWDAYVGKIRGRFCEEGAPLNPDDNPSLVFQRQDQTPRFIPPDKLKHMDQAESRRNPQSSEVSTRNLLPDDITRRFHPNTLGQSIIAQIALANIARAKAEQLAIVKITNTCTLYPATPTCKEDERTVITHPRFDRAVHEFCEAKSDFAVTSFESNKALELRFSAIAGSSCGPSDCMQSMNNLYDQCSNDHGAYRGVTGPGYIGGEGSFSSKCGVYSFKMTDSTEKFPPGADAVGPDGAIIKPWCSVVEEPFVPHEDLLAAVTEYCDKQGEQFYQGHKQITHKIGSGPETHIYTNAIDISKKAGDHYKHDDVCEDFSGTIRQSDCVAGFLVIINECGGDGGKSFPWGAYTYNCVYWQLSPYPQ